LITIGLIILAITFAYGIVLLSLRRSDSAVVSIISPFVYGICFILSLFILFGILSDESFALPSAALGYTTFKLNFTLTVSRLTAVILCFASLIAICISVFSVNGTDKDETGSNRAYLAFSLFGISGLALSGNILVLFIFSAITSLVSYLILNKKGKKLYLFKTVTLNVVSDLALLTGILLIFSIVKLFDFEDILNAINTGNLSGPLFIISGACLVTGALSKAAVFPFHNWLTTNEEISDKSENIFLSLSMLPAGIVLAIRLSPLFVPGILNAMVCIGVVSIFYGLILSCFQDNLRHTIKFLAIAHSGLIFTAIGSGNIASAVLLLAAVSIARLALLQSDKIIGQDSPQKKSVLFYWLFFSSAAAFIGLPLSALFLTYGSILKSAIFFNGIIPGLNTLYAALIMGLCALGAFNIFKFVFQKNSTDYNDFSISDLKNPGSYSGIIILLLSSFFAWFSLSPYNVSLIWIPGYLNLTNSFVSLAPQSSGIPFLELFLTLFSIALGVMAAFFITAKRKQQQNAVSHRIYGFERFFDNAFARYLIAKDEHEADDSAISLNKFFARFLKLDEPGAYISFSLLLIVIFYFIFRTM